MFLMLGPKQGLKSSFAKVDTDSKAFIQMQKLEKTFGAQVFAASGHCPECEYYPDTA